MPNGTRGRLGPCQALRRVTEPDAEATFAIAPKRTGPRLPAERTRPKTRKMFWLLSPSRRIGRFDFLVRAVFWYAVIFVAAFSAYYLTSTSIVVVVSSFIAILCSFGVF